MRAAGGVRGGGGGGPGDPGPPPQTDLLPPPQITQVFFNLQYVHCLINSQEF